MESVGVCAESAATGVAAGAALGFGEDEPPDAARRVESAAPQPRTKVKASEAAPNALIGESMGVRVRGRAGGCRGPTSSSSGRDVNDPLLAPAPVGKIATVRT